MSRLHGNSLARPECTGGGEEPGKRPGLEQMRIALYEVPVFAGGKFCTVKLTL